jgi:hypothetical protein
MAIAHLLFTNPQKAEGRNALGAQLSRPCTVLPVRNILLYLNNRYHTCTIFEMPDKKNTTLFS